MHGHAFDAWSCVAMWFAAAKIRPKQAMVTEHTQYAVNLHL
jgi:hypothetical protein